MAKRTAKSAEPDAPAEVSEEDLVQDDAAGGGEKAVPLTPRAADPAGGANRASSGEDVRAAVETWIHAILRGPLTKYLGYSIVLHVAFVLVFSLPGWVLPERAPSNGEEAKKQQASAAAAPGQSEKKPAQATDKKGGAARDPLEQTKGEDRVKKLLGHETASPSEVPKSPLDAAGAKDDILGE